MSERNDILSRLAARDPGSKFADAIREGLVTTAATSTRITTATRGQSTGRLDSAWAMIGE